MIDVPTPHPMLVAGHICLDLWPRLDRHAAIRPGMLVEVGPVAMSLGGCIGNTARDLSALGADVRVATCVGDDEFSDIVRSKLASSGLERGDVVSVPGVATSYSLVLEQPGVDRTIWHHVGANVAFTGASVDIAGVDLLHLGYPPLLPALTRDEGALLLDLLDRARAAGLTTSVDMAVVDRTRPHDPVDWTALLPRMVSRCDVVTPSLDDLTSALGLEPPFSAHLVDDLLDQLLAWGAAIAAVSDGEHGLFIATAGADRLAQAGRTLAGVATGWADLRMHVPSLWHGEPVTTNGAGDASTAGLLFGLAVEADPRASAAAAASCSAVALSGRDTSREALYELNPDLRDVLRR